MAAFSERVQALPHLGLGVSTEYGAAASPDGLDVPRLRREYPQFADFLEVGVEAGKGLDSHARAWVADGLPTTYHFLDINLDDPADFDVAWLDEVRGLAERMSPAWMCGDAGLWHFGRRDRGHMLLLPPILSDDNATAMAEGVSRLRTETGYEVLPENPPGEVFLGDLHLLEFYARLCERADTGMLLDCAHLAIYQRMCGHSDPLTGLDGFDLDRIVEVHIAGGTLRETDGFTFVEDTHTAAVLPETWTIFRYIAERAPNLKAVVFECERNPLEQPLLDVYGQIAQVLDW
ncbi:MAG: hypothetical protein ACI9WU_001373 [Myxococcota bacterium]|jgi:uncharacterized protein (UPF0276 family)